MVEVHPEACSFYPSGSVSVDVRFVGFGKVTLDIDLLCTCDCTDNTVSYCVLSLLMMYNTRPHFIVAWGEMYDLRSLHDINEIAFIESPMLFQTSFWERLYYHSNTTSYKSIVCNFKLPIKGS